MNPYAIEHVETPIIRTGEWVPAMVSSDVWWISGGGLNRPCTDTEKELAKELQALKVDIQSARLKLDEECNKNAWGLQELRHPLDGGA